MRREQYTQTARFVIWSLILGVAGMLYLDNNPLHLEDPEPEPAALTAPTSRTGDVVLVIDSDAIARSAEEGRFSATDFSWAWLNTLEQEIGPCTILERRDLRAADLTPYRFLILSHAAAGQDADDDLISHLNAFASAGGVVLLERPGARLRAAFSADGSAGVHTPGRITRVDNLSAPFDAQLSAIPLMTSFVGSAQPAPNARTFLAMDGVPVVYGVPKGKGAAITVEFDYGRQLTALQQGLPNDDFSIPNRYNFATPPRLQAIDLVGDKSLLNTSIPAADLLERFMIHAVLGAYQPIVALWPFRGGAQGALIMSHAESDGAQATWMARWEHEHSHDSTVFLTVPPHLPRSELARLQGVGADVQLLWHRPLGGYGLFEKVGLGGIHPLARPVSLTQQTERLNELFNKRRTVRAARTWGGVWGPEWDEPFLDLASVNIPLDSSLGPREYGRGYLFGTGLPYRAIAKTGQPIPVTELPPILDLNPDNADHQFLRELLTRSRDDHHQAITVTFDPSSWQRAPSLDLFDLWQASFALAEDHQHWTTHITRFHRFWQERLKGDLRVRTRIELPSSLPDPIDPADKLDAPPGDNEPVAPADLRTPEQDPIKRSPPNLILHLEIKIDAESHTALVPRTLQGRTFQSVRAARTARTPPGGEPPIFTTTTSLIGLPYLLVPLKKGLNALEIIYR